VLLLFGLGPGAAAASFFLLSSVQLICKPSPSLRFLFLNLQILFLQKRHKFRSLGGPLPIWNSPARFAVPRRVLSQQSLAIRLFFRRPFPFSCDMGDGVPLVVLPSFVFYGRCRRCFSPEESISVNLTMDEGTLCLISLPPLRISYLRNQSLRATFPASPRSNSSQVRELST